jgi:hypothetical protein
MMMQDDLMMDHVVEARPRSSQGEIHVMKLLDCF